jgi:hypothetical protein
MTEPESVEHKISCGSAAWREFMKYPLCDWRGTWAEAVVIRYVPRELQTLYSQSLTPPANLFESGNVAPPVRVCPNCAKEMVEHEYGWAKVVDHG